MRLYSVGLEFAVVEVAPELLVLGAVAVGRLDKHAVMLALDLVQPVAERREEIVVGGDDRAVQVEFDDGLGLADGGDLALVIGVLQLGGGDVRGELDDFERLAVEVEDGVVGGLNPDFLAALADALVFRRLEFAVD